jgi:hypothetical protein
VLLYDKKTIVTNSYTIIQRSLKEQKKGNEKRRRKKMKVYCCVYSRCYAVNLKWAVISEPFLGNGSYSNDYTCKEGNGGVVYAVRAEDLKRSELEQPVRFIVGSQFSTGLQHVSIGAILNVRYQEISSGNFAEE